MAKKYTEIFSNLDGVNKQLGIGGNVVAESPKEVVNMNNKTNDNKFSAISSYFSQPEDQVEDDLLRQAMELARMGKNKELSTFLKQHKGQFDVNGTDDKGRNLAHYAAMSGNPKILNTVKNAGTDVTATDNNGNTIIHTVASKMKGGFASDKSGVGFIKTAERFGVDPTEPNDNGQTALDIIAPVNEEDKRIVDGVPDHNMFGEGIDANGNRCPVTFYRPNEGAVETAEYLADKEGDARPIESDTRTSMERGNDLLNGRIPNLGSFNDNDENLRDTAFDLLNRGGGSLKNTLKESQTANNNLDESNVVDSAFNLIQRGNNER